MKRPAQPITVDTSTVVRILLLITAFVGGIWLINRLHTELLWIGVAFFLAVALDPAVHWIDRVLKCGRLAATFLVLVVFLLILGFLAASLIPPLISQTEALANQIPHALQQAQNSNTYLGHLVQHYHLVERAHQLQSKVLDDAANNTGVAFGFLRSLFNGATAIIVTLFITFFMLLEGPHWLTLGWRFVPIDEKSHYHRLTTKMYKIVAGYMTGNLIIGLLMTVFATIIMAIFGVPYAIPLGILSGLCTLIPIVGGFISLVIVCGVALFTSVTAAIVLAIFFLVYSFIDGHVLRPIVYGRTLEMSSLVVIVALVLGTALDGIVGAIVAIPVVACLGVLFSDWVEGPRKHPEVPPEKPTQAAAKKG